MAAWIQKRTIRFAGVLEFMDGEIDAWVEQAEEPAFERCSLPCLAALGRKVVPKTAWVASSIPHAM